MNHRPQGPLAPDPFFRLPHLWMPGLWGRNDWADPVYCRDNYLAMTPPDSPGPLGVNDLCVPARILDGPFLNHRWGLQRAEPAAEQFPEVLIIDADEFQKELNDLAATGKKIGEAIKQYLPTTVDTVKDLLPAVKYLGWFGKASIRTIKGKQYVVIAGYAGLRKILKGTKYLASNAAVKDLVIGVARHGEEALKSFRLGVIVVAVVDVLEAALDWMFNDKEFLTKELGFTIVADIGKQAISTLVGYLVGAGLAAAGIPVAFPIAAGIVLGLVVGLALDYILPTEKIVAVMTDLYNDFLDRANLMYYEMHRGIYQLYGVPMY